MAWLKAKPHHNAERQTSGNLIMDPEIVKHLEDTIDTYCKKEMPIKRIGMRVKPQLIYRVSLVKISSHYLRMSLKSCL